MTGEEKHETCRYGRLSEGWTISMLPNGRQKTVEGLVSLCTWSLPHPAPPAAIRAWGGLVDMEKDCRVCGAWTNDLSTED